MNKSASKEVVEGVSEIQSAFHVSDPLLVIAEDGVLNVTGDDYSVCVGNEQMLVITMPGKYYFSYGVGASFESRAVEGNAYSFSGNFIVNINDCRNAVNLLRVEVPLFYLGGKLVTMSCPGISKSKYLDRKKYFKYGDVDIYLCDPVQSKENNKIYDSVIIGAGPYGVSSAISLKSNSLDIYWVGEPLSFWLRNIQPTELRSVKSATNIFVGREGFSFIDFCNKYKIDKEGKIIFWQFLAYYFCLIVEFDVIPEYEKVTNISYKDEVWCVDIEGVAGKKTVFSNAIVNATGIGMHPNVPSVFSCLPSKVSSHVSQDAVQVFPQNKDIAVIGGAQSAIEYALEADRCNNRVSMYVRNKLVYRNLHDPSQVVYRYLASNCEKFIGYLPVKLKTVLLNYLLEGTCDPEMKEKLENSNIVIKEKSSVERACLINNDSVELITSDGAEIVDKVIVATGYFYDIHNIKYLSNLLDESKHVQAGRFPSLDKSAMLKNAPSGLYFTGFSCLYAVGFKSQFINGTNIIVKKILDDIKRRS